MEGIGNERIDAKLGQRGADVAVATGNGGEPLSGQRIRPRREESVGVDAPDLVRRGGGH